MGRKLCSKDDVRVVNRVVKIMLTNVITKFEI